MPTIKGRAGFAGAAVFSCWEGHLLKSKREAC
jgi:hypothetical protein